MTLNAQAGKLLLEALSNQLQMCWLSIGKLTALLAINIKPSQEELRPQRQMSQTMPYSSTQHSVACVTEMLPLCCSAWHHSWCFIWVGFIGWVMLPFDEYSKWVQGRACPVKYSRVAPYSSSAKDLEQSWTTPTRTKHSVLLISGKVHMPTLCIEMWRAACSSCTRRRLCLYSDTQRRSVKEVHKLMLCLGLKALALRFILGTCVSQC